MKIAAAAVPVYSSDGTKLIGQLESGQQVINLTESDGGTVIAYLLGLVKAKDSGNLVDQDTWEKSAGEIDKFLTYAAAQVGCLYVSGAQGQTMTAKLVRALEKDDSNYNRALASFNRHTAAGTSLIAYDCSGLVMAYIENQRHLVSSDRTANGIYYDLCTAIQESDLRAGDLVFKKNLTNSRMHHVGIYMGDGTVVHSKGRDYGVIRERYGIAGWTRYGRLKIFAQCVKAASFSRTITLSAPNMMGDDIREVQQRLYNKGFDPQGIDGVFGSRTQSALEAFQKAAGLAADGTVTQEVWEKLTA